MKSIYALIDTHLVLKLSELPTATIEELKTMFTRSNPVFYKKKRMGFYVGDTPPLLHSWKQQGTFLVLPRGSILDIEKVLNRAGLTVYPTIDKTISFDPIEYKIQAGLKMRPYQQEAVDALVEAKCGIVRGSCGSGKSILLIGAIQKIGQPTIVIVHSKILQDQWVSFISQWFGIIPGTLGGGKKARVSDKITVATQQTLWRMVEKCDPVFKKFGVVICDEIHHFSAVSFKAVADTFASKHRIGASADERRKDGLEFLIHETFGETVKKISREELIDLGKLLPTRIELIRTDYEDEYYLDSIRCGDTVDWVHMITRMTEDESRNEIILHNILRVLNDNSDNKILLLNERTEACRKWVDTLNRLGISAGLMIGGTPNKSDLNSSIAGLHNGTISVGVGTTVADEGMDIPSLTHTFVTCPVHTHLKRLTQMIGRSARVCGNKKQAVCVYFWDRKMFPPMLDDSNPTKRSSDEDRFITKFKTVAEEIVIV